MDSKENMIYWKMSDFGLYDTEETECKMESYFTKSPTTIFSEILGELEASYNKKFKASIDLKSAFRKGLTYVFYTKEKDKDSQMHELFIILDGWEKHQWDLEYLENLNCFLIDLVKRYNEKDGKFIAILDEEIDQIETAIDDAVKSLVYLDIDHDGQSWIMAQMRKALEELQKKYLGLKKEGYDDIFDFVKGFYGFRDQFLKKIDPKQRESQRHWRNILLTKMLGDGIEDFAKRYPDRGIERCYLSAPVENSIKKGIEKGLSEMPKIDIKPNLRKMSEEDLLVLQYHILDELSSRIITKNDIDN